MKRLIFLIIFLFPLPAYPCWISFCPDFTFQHPFFAGKVVGVTGGDTIKVLMHGKAQRVRLFGVDSPEKKQAFGQKAKEFTSNHVFGKSVIVEIKDIDRWGRIVGEVWLGEKSLNRELVKNGFAWWYREYSKDESLGKLEEEARKAKRGLWVDPNPIPPWEWRKRKQKSLSCLQMNFEVEAFFTYLFLSSFFS